MNLNNSLILSKKLVPNLNEKPEVISVLLLVTVINKAKNGNKQIIATKMQTK